MYSPKIKENHVRELYQLKQVLNKPITTLANDAIAIYLTDKRLILQASNAHSKTNLTPKIYTESKRSINILEECLK